MPISENAIRAKLVVGEIDYALHAIFEAAQDLIFVDEIDSALSSGEIIEDDKNRNRCLVCASIVDGFIHVVLDYGDWLIDPGSNLVVVTVYRPDPDEWIDERTRRI